MTTATIDTTAAIREKFQLAATALKASDTPVRINHDDVKFIAIHKYMYTSTRWSRGTTYNEAGAFYSVAVPGIRVRRATKHESYKPQWIMERS